MSETERRNTDRAFAGDWKTWKAFCIDPNAIVGAPAALSVRGRTVMC